MAASSVSFSVFADESEQPTEAPAALSENYTDERFSNPVFWDGMESPLQDAAVAPVLMQEDNVINYNGNKTELIQLDSKLQRIFPSDLQIPCPELNGVYFYDGSTLIFYDFGSKSYSKVAVFDGGTAAGMIAGVAVTGREQASGDGQLGQHTLNAAL